MGLDLKQRLTVLQRQRGGAASDTAALPAMPDTSASVGWRLQRLYGADLPDTTSETREERVAQLLHGTRIAAGLIVVEQQFPLIHQHGTRDFAALRAHLHTPSLAEQPLSPDNLIFLDTETTGLAGGTGTLAFLLGLGRIVGDVLHLCQFFLTGFRGEAALLQAAQAWSAGGKHLVTFNGKSFDAPLMATRYRLAGLRDPFAEMHHVDLFHPTRRAFSRQWPDCRLQTAERYLLGFQRHDDLPASLVPDVWFAFVRHGTTRQLPRLLAHNRWDLMSLAALLPSLAEVFSAPGDTGADVLAVARYWLQRGDEAAALAHLQTNQTRLSTDGLLELARLYRRRQTWEAAVSIWRRLAEHNCLEALERLAKYYEHVQGDHHTALSLTRRLRHLDAPNGAHIQREQRLVAKLTRL